MTREDFPKANSSRQTMNRIEWVVFYTLLLAIGISIFTITACQIPLR